MNFSLRLLSAMSVAFVGNGALAATDTKNDTPSLHANATDWPANLSSTGIQSFAITLSTTNATNLPPGGNVSIENLIFHRMSDLGGITDTNTLMLNNAKSLTVTAASHCITVKHTGPSLLGGHPCF